MSEVGRCGAWPLASRQHPDTQFCQSANWIWHATAQCINPSRRPSRHIAVHWTHDAVATLNQRRWRWFNVATTSCVQCMDVDMTLLCSSMTLIQRRNNNVWPVDAGSSATTLRAVYKEVFDWSGAVNKRGLPRTVSPASLRGCDHVKYWPRMIAVLCPPFPEHEARPNAGLTLAHFLLSWPTPLQRWSVHCVLSCTPDVTVKSGVLDTPPISHP